MNSPPPVLASPKRSHASRSPKSPSPAPRGGYPSPVLAPLPVPVENPMPQLPRIQGIDPALESFQMGAQGDKIACVMVGLPARGKTYVARRLGRYLEFFHGAPTKVFHVSDYRRKMYGNNLPAEFFDAFDEERVKARFEASKAAMQDCLNFLHTQEEGLLKRVGIYDAPNITVDRRTWIKNIFAEANIRVIFIECIYTSEEFVSPHIKETIRTSPDYQDWTDISAAVDDFKQRIEHYRLFYVPIQESECLPYIKMYDNGKKVEISGVYGYMQSKIIQFLLNVRHSGKANFFLTRHGQSEYNALGKIGGDSPLSEQGRKYAGELQKFAKEKVARDENGGLRRARLWTSSMRRTIETGSYISHEVLDDGWINMRPRVWRLLDELYAGICDGMTYQEIKDAYPEEYARRKKDKLEYRYPRGESYLDLIARLDPLVHEMERIKEPLLIIGHQAIIRVLYCYFMGLPRESATSISIPLHTVICLTHETYACKEERFHLLEGEDEAPSH